MNVENAFRGLLRGGFSDPSKWENLYKGLLRSEAVFRFRPGHNDKTVNLLIGLCRNWENGIYKI